MTGIRVADALRQSRRRPPSATERPSCLASRLRSPIAPAWLAARRRREPSRPGRRPARDVHRRAARPLGLPGRRSGPSRPTVKEAGWVRNPIDRFILAGLEEVGLPARPRGRSRRPDPPRHVRPDRPAADARGGRGVPRRRPGPTPTSGWSIACSASPHYGERWAQHWLDLAHYADSNGFELDAERPDAWRYRDWVVKALNADMPYDRFVTLQLAGDEVAPGDHDALIATGFGRCGPREVVGGNVDPEVKRQSELTEITGTVGSVFLGLTIGCARCHDHKFDAMPTTDYYRLQSFFAAVELVDVPIASKAERGRLRGRREGRRRRRSPRSGSGWPRSRPPTARPSREQKQAMLTAAERAVMAIPDEGADARPEAAGRRACRSRCKVTWEEVAEAVADEPRRPRRARAAEAARSTRSSGPCPVPRRRPWPWSTRKPRPPRRSSSAAATPRTAGPKVAPRPPGVVLASQPAATRSRDAIAPTGDDHRPPLGPGALAGPARQPADGPGDRQPALAAPLRPGDRRHAQRLRRPGRAARRIPSCSTGWRPSWSPRAGGSSRSTA